MHQIISRIFGAHAINMQPSLLHEVAEFARSNCDSICLESLTNNSNSIRCDARNSGCYVANSIWIICHVNDIGGCHFRSTEEALPLKLMLLFGLPTHKQLQSYNIFYIHENRWKCYYLAHAHPILMKYDGIDHEHTRPYREGDSERERHKIRLESKSLIKSQNHINCTKAPFM